MRYLQGTHAHDVLQVACYSVTISSMMVSPCFQAVVVHMHLISGDSALHIVTAFTFLMFEVGQ
jgi:hypothetical protein